VCQSLVDASAQHMTARDGIDGPRVSLARWMRGQWQPDDAAAIQPALLRALLGNAWAEGVTALVAHGLGQCPGAPAALRDAFAAAAHAAAMPALRREADGRRVLFTLHAEGVPALLLKGGALAHWLYPAPYLRECSDLDLLFVDREQALHAAQVLAKLGYATPYQPSRFQHELACRPADGRGLELDLHWALSDWPVLDRLPAFAELDAAGIDLPGLGAGARGLGAPHALLHACAHRASNLAAGLGDRLKWLYDLHLLAQTLDRAGTWQQFTGACQQAGLCGIAAEGLDATAALFGTPVPQWVPAALAAGRATEPLDATRLDDWRYVQRLNLRALPDWEARLAWIGGRLLPPAGHLRVLYGEDLGYPALLWRRLRNAGSRLCGG
jgi:hypothetical protein